MTHHNGHNSSVEDAGRRESENIMQKKAKKEYLADVEEEADLDYAEASERIEREERLLGTIDQGFLSSIDLAFHQKAMEKAEQAASRNDYAVREPGADTDTLHREVNNLLRSCHTLIEANRKASEDVMAFRKSMNAKWDSYQRALAADRAEVKKVLEAGKRVVGREIQAFGRHEASAAPDGDLMKNLAAKLLGQETEGSERAKGYRTQGLERGEGSADHNREVTKELAARLLGWDASSRSEAANLDRELKRVKKGVKKMVKGMDAV